MANSRSSAERYEYATVNDESDAASDSDPLTTGYWTNPVIYKTCIVCEEK